MLIRTLAPSEILNDYVKQYWILETEISDKNVGCRVTPIGTVEIMFHYKTSFAVKKSSGEEYYQPRSFVSGISSQFSDVMVRDQAGVIAVTFHPFGAYHFFDFPLSEIEEQAVSLDCICRKELNSIEEQLSEASSTEGRIVLIEKFLKSRLKERKSNDVLLIRGAVNIINKSRGRINSLELSKKLYVEPKNLERKFSSLIGKMPKQFIKIVRCNNVMNSLISGSYENLTRLAYENGYFDQSHMIKDFKSFSGCTPGEFGSLYPCI